MVQEELRDSDSMQPPGLCACVSTPTVSRPAMLFRWVMVCALIGVAAASSGCSSLPRPARFRTADAAQPETPAHQSEQLPADAEPAATLLLVDFSEAASPAAIESFDDPFVSQTELPLELLVAEVLSRNQSLQAALAAWQSAAQRYPQAIAFDDPMFQSMFAPASFGNSTVPNSYLVGVTQKVPWFGKRGLRGDIANAEAAAMSFDFAEAQLRLTEAAQLAYYDYFLVYREFEVNDANITALRSFRDTATQRYEQNLVSQQDVLQAEVELAKLERRRLEIERMRRVAQARINTLLHRRPDVALPLPPARLEVPDTLPDLEPLWNHAVQQRPELSALASRIRGEQQAVELACREYYPDFDFIGRYDSFWAAPQRAIVGMDMNIPLNQRKRAAAVQEAVFRVRKLQAEYHQAIDNIRNDVQAGVAKLDESRKVVRLYTDRILPTAQENVASAQAGYVAGTLDFLRVIAAETELIQLQEQYYVAVAEYHQRRAELERVVGSPLFSSAE